MGFKFNPGTGCGCCEEFVTCTFVRVSACRLDQTFYTVFVNVPNTEGNPTQLTETYLLQYDSDIGTAYRWKRVNNGDGRDVEMDLTKETTNHPVEGLARGLIKLRVWDDTSEILFECDGEDLVQTVTPPMGFEEPIPFTITRFTITRLWTFAEMAAVTFTLTIAGVVDGSSSTCDESWNQTWNLAVDTFSVSDGYASHPVFIGNMIGTLAPIVWFDRENVGLDCFGSHITVDFGNSPGPYWGVPCADLPDPRLMEKIDNPPLMAFYVGFSVPCTTTPPGSITCDFSGATASLIED